MYWKIVIYNRYGEIVSTHELRGMYETEMGANAEAECLASRYLKPGDTWDLVQGFVDVNGTDAIKYAHACGYKD